jgi:hypothetical protein
MSECRREYYLRLETRLHLNVNLFYFSLSRCGLRDVPTFIANMMLPFGNLTVCFMGVVEPML